MFLTQTVRSVAHKACRQLPRFARSNNGSTAIIFALSMIPVLAVGGAGIDLARAMMVKARLSSALDAAALAVGKTSGLTTPQIQALAQKYFDANYPSGTSLGTHDAVAVTVNGPSISLRVNGTVPTTLLKLVHFDQLHLGVRNTVTRNTTNVEVALALDNTGSMAGTKIADLKDAAKDLIDLVVLDDQSLAYSKVALAPYSMGVNVGAYANQVRGAIAPGKTITAATKANPIVITANTHGFATNDYIYITGVSGMTQLNNKPYQVVKVDANRFQLKDTSGTLINSTSYSTFTVGAGTAAAYCTKGGGTSAAPITPACPYYRFQNSSGNWNLFQVSTCVTERSTNPYNDVAPSTTPLGRNYPAVQVTSTYPVSSTNPCTSSLIAPLSPNRTTLHTAVDNMTAGGSTGGHIGVAWGWYLLSPNFGYLWPGQGQAAAYTAPNTVKVAVIMTDGEYNSSYCNGVISQDSTSGSGSSSDHINCNAPNGNTYTQAQALCTAMKASKIIIYTVGFQVVSAPAATALINNCATDAQHVYIATTGGDLKAAFHAIAVGISQLRLSK